MTLHSNLDQPAKGEPARRTHWIEENPAMSYVISNIKRAHPNLVGGLSNQDLLNALDWANGFDDVDEVLTQTLIDMQGGEVQAYHNATKGQ